MALGKEVYWFKLVVSENTHYSVAQLSVNELCNLSTNNVSSRTYSYIKRTSIELFYRSTIVE
ncbi:hypothetical protein Mic7113_2019 [Allocoleopsis franciscana PCC 7113]|uniref:Uncharacterized protein n=1 Tax=Allocoleopsis franciscana PCC 7113 TaxID=1173027 RepID=K9WBU8_9CYAN|nr:hypothetical protein Mic7113_2019 [Allocoleopsis franciscana PCC 7113]